MCVCVYVSVQREAMNKSYGESCIYDAIQVDELKFLYKTQNHFFLMICSTYIQTFSDWQADRHLIEMNRLYQKHRLYIAENILTLRCPRNNCRAAMYDFTGCFAVICYACNCGYCAWCFKDCGADAHNHGMLCDDICFIRRR